VTVSFYFIIIIGVIFYCVSLFPRSRTRNPLNEHFFENVVLLCYVLLGPFGSTNFLTSYDVTWLESLAMLHSSFSVIFIYFFIKIILV